jgi:hypothetical protein
MVVHDRLNGMQVPPYNAFNKHYWEYAFELDVIYSHIPNGFLPMKTTHETWRSA